MPPTALQLARIILADNIGFVRVMYPLLPGLSGGQAHKINSVSRYSIPVTAMCYGENKETVILGYQNGKVEIYHIPLHFTAYTNDTYKFKEPMLITYTNISAVIDLTERQVLRETPEDKDQALRQRISPREIRAIAFAKPNHLAMITSNSRVHYFTLDKEEGRKPTVSFLSSFQMPVNIVGPTPLPAPTLEDYEQPEPPPELRNASSEAYILIPIGSKIYAACGGWGHSPRIYDSYTGKLVYVPRDPPPSFPARVNPRFIATCFCYDEEDGIFVIGDMDGYIHCYRTGLWGPELEIAERPENITGWNEPKELKRRGGRSIQSVAELVPHNKVEESHKHPYWLSDGVISSAALWYVRYFERKVCTVSIVTIRLDGGIGKYLFAANGEGTTDLLSLETGKLCRRFNKHGGAVKSCVFLRYHTSMIERVEQMIKKEVQKVNRSDNDSSDDSHASDSNDHSSVKAADGSASDTQEQQTPAIELENITTAHTKIHTTDTLIFTGCLDKNLRTYVTGSREPLSSHYVVNNPLILLPAFATVHYKRAPTEEEQEEEDQLPSDSESFADESERPVNLPEDSIDDMDLDLNIVTEVREPKKKSKS